GPDDARGLRFRAQGAGPPLRLGWPARNRRTPADQHRGRPAVRNRDARAAAGDRGRSADARDRERAGAWRPDMPDLEPGRHDAHPLHSHTGTMNSQLPDPEITPVNAPYWQALDEGRLVYQCCEGCGNRWLPPRPECPRCLGDAWTWRDASGRGR